MIYKEFKNLKLSTLGYGGMRLPVDESTGKLCPKKAEEAVDHAYNNGVNFFDTAYFYHSGESESALGKMLAKYPRDTWYLADKMPGNFFEIVDGKIVVDIGWANLGRKVYNNPAEIFEYQLNKCAVEYFDFYMLHNVAESTYDIYTDEKLGLVDYVLKEKEAGRIKHLGFSSHGRHGIIEKFLNKYDCFEFALLQINYLDWSLQEANKKYDILTKRNIPIFVMEPVRGGMLAAPGTEAEKVLKTVRPSDTPASWAFRFLQSLPNVSVIVSGMSKLEHLKENLELFSKDDPMSEEEKVALQKVVDGMASFVPCTDCRYCCGTCPQNLDIPLLISTYNEAAHAVSWHVEDILNTLPDEKKPQACIDCGVCNPLCPQNIDIAEIMKKFSALL
ncbi:MAG: aldo/keto reductase [Oscillospiraceae bacterium]|jgi:predicted aldo/keto reductase-like oxidoreductase|nr:aldo/keto reductase [Oscillospiraceae bacterium]